VVTSLLWLVIVSHLSLKVSGRFKLTTLSTMSSSLRRLCELLPLGHPCSVPVPCNAAAPARVRVYLLRRHDGTTSLPYPLWQWPPYLQRPVARVEDAHQRTALPFPTLLSPLKARWAPRWSILYLSSVWLLFFLDGIIVLPRWCRRAATRPRHFVCSYVFLFLTTMLIEHNADRYFGDKLFANI
jgi:hypothetical protein